MSEQKRGTLKQIVGEVISDKMNKTISVVVYRLVKHGKYGKYVRRSTVYRAHDENNTAKIGDKVLLSASRPLSKTKRWRLVKVVEAAKGVEQ
jgi:small subunit ribosomal protein S17